MSTSASHRIALVTGANKGIGFETARQLAEAGLTVWIGSRDGARGAEAARRLKDQGLAVEAIALDVTRRDSLEAAATTLKARHGRLDVLVNNAGVLVDVQGQAPSAQSLETWRRTFETNVFGLIEATQVLLPLLRQSAAARIVNVSSVLGSIAAHGDPASPYFHVKVPAYNVSKSAVNAWTVQLAYELRETPHKVNAIHPGYVKTDMGGAGAELEVPEGARTSVWAALLPADGPSGGYFHLPPGAREPQRLSW